MILDKYYNDSRIRVVRRSHPEESNDSIYYELLKYMRLYVQKFVPQGLHKNEIKSVNKEFYPKVIAYLRNASCLVFSIEGNLYSTGDSSGIFNHGIFKVACKMEPQPLIVQEVTANFD